MQTTVTSSSLLMLSIPERSLTPNPCRPFSSSPPTHLLCSCLFPFHAMASNPSWIVLHTVRFQLIPGPCGPLCLYSSYGVDRMALAVSFPCFSSPVKSPRTPSDAANWGIGPLSSSFMYFTMLSHLFIPPHLASLRRYSPFPRFKLIFKLCFEEWWCILLYWSCPSEVEQFTHFRVFEYGFSDEWCHIYSSCLHIFPKFFLVTKAFELRSWPTTK